MCAVRGRVTVGVCSQAVGVGAVRERVEVGVGAVRERVEVGMGAVRERVEVGVGAVRERVAVGVGAVRGHNPAQGPVLMPRRAWRD